MTQLHAERYRLVTRSDFDGLVCAALLRQMDILGDVKFVHPKDVQDGKVELGPSDITTNLPYHPGVHLAFDHHSSEMVRIARRHDNHVIWPGAESAARVVYEYYGGAPVFPSISEEMMDAVDKADAAQFTLEEILNPEGWVLLNFLMDPRTGLGRFRNFRISNYQLMMQLIDACTTMTVGQILRTPDVAERVELYHEHAERAKEQVLRCATVHGNLVVLDLRNEEIIHPTNRFMIYALFPQCNISMHILWGLKQQNTVFATGKSILDRSSRTNIGELMLSYGGGGHDAAGTCQVSNTRAPKVLGELIERINADELVEEDEPAVPQRPAVPRAARRRALANHRRSSMSSSSCSASWSTCSVVWWIPNRSCRSCSSSRLRAVAVVARAHEHVGGERREARGDLPHVEVVDLDDPGRTGERAADVLGAHA